MKKKQKMTISPNSVRLLIVDRNRFAASAQAIAFKTVPFIDDVVWVSSFRDVNGIAESFQPTIALVHLNPPVIEAFEIAEHLITKPSDCQVIMMDDRVRGPLIQTTIKAKLSGYWTCRWPFDEIVHAVEKAVKGNKTFSSDTKRFIKKTNRGIVYSPSTKEMPYAPLTIREFEALELVSKGLSNQEIAKVMKVSTKTVENYKHILRQKFDANNVVQILQIAMQEKLIKW
jgi:DNA-binding NarL/FixJ family response regulator